CGITGLSSLASCSLDCELLQGHLMLLTLPIHTGSNFVAHNTFGFQSSEKMFLWPDLVFMPLACDFTRSPLEREPDIFIAIEIENHLKSRARLVEKYLRLGNYSLCDGVLYLLPRVHWESTLREIYTAKALPDLYRIGHYGQTFLATGFYDDVQTDIGELPVTPRLSAQNFHQWCAKLIATRFEDRRDPVTSHPGAGPG
ncbi:MAG: hypothetical protein JST16_01530, partial [Bdellovibrionales bacterium]|nr:hypothetical protein [Bdellovibrionales bacterium]